MKAINNFYWFIFICWVGNTALERRHHAVIENLNFISRVRLKSIRKIFVP